MKKYSKAYIRSYFTIILCLKHKKSSANVVRKIKQFYLELSLFFFVFLRYLNLKTHLIFNSFQKKRLNVFFVPQVNLTLYI